MQQVHTTYNYCWFDFYIDEDEGNKFLPLFFLRNLSVIFQFNKYHQKYHIHVHNRVVGFVEGNNFIWIFICHSNFLFSHDFFLFLSFIPSHDTTRRMFPCTQGLLLGEEKEGATAGFFSWRWHYDCDYDDDDDENVAKGWNAKLYYVFE